MTAPSLFHYRMFGLSVASELPLPEALQSERVSDPDVRIRLQEIDVPPTPPGICTVGSCLILTVPDVARYLIREGREVQIDRHQAAPDRNVRLYLLGSAMGALLHQRGVLPLHANAVEIDGCAFAFVGESGAGKSTLAGLFHDRGHRVMSDDVCVVGEIETGRPVVEPALRRLRLCRDALIASGRDPIDFEPSYSGDPAFDKFDVPLGPVSSADPIPLAAVILLEFGVTEILQEVGGVEAATILFAHTYRGGIVDQSGTAEMHWQAVVRLVTTVRIFRWQRPRDRAGIEPGISRLVTTLRALGAGGPDQSLVDQVG